MVVVTRAIFVALVVGSHLSAAPVPVGKPLHCKVDAPVTALAASPSGGYLALGTCRGDLAVWDPQLDRIIVQRSERDFGTVGTLAYANDGNFLLICSTWQGYGVRLADGRLVRPMSEAARLPRKPGLLVLHDMPDAISNIRITRVSDLVETARHAVDVPWVRGAAFLPDSRLVAGLASRADRSVLLTYDGSGVAVQRMKWEAKPYGIRDGTFSPDGRHFAALNERRIELYDITTKRLICSHDSGPEQGVRASGAPDGTALGVATLRHQVTVWDVATGTRHRVTTPDDGKPFIPGFVEPVTFAGPSRVAVGLHDGRVLVHDWKARKNVRFLHGPASPVTVLAASPDGAWLFAGCRDGTVWRWRTP
ncbi:MAG: WD40 repeat domain-containing protein [Gemmataceae bacterium]